VPDCRNIDGVNPAPREPMSDWADTTHHDSNSAATLNGIAKDTKWIERQLARTIGLAFLISTDVPFSVR
jgi:hypothetical protein